jgi:hypothetical protein
LGTDTFAKNNSNCMKSLQKLMDKPARIAFVNELPASSLNRELILDFVDGHRLAIKPLYMPEIDVTMQAKLNFMSNFDVNLNNDGASVRRGILLDFNSRFLDKGHNDIDPSNHCYEGDKHLMEKFEKDEFKLAYIHYLMPYVKEYYKNNCLIYISEEVEDKFAETLNDYDELKQRVMSLVEKTGDDTDTIGKQELHKKLRENVGNEDWGKLTNRTLLNRLKSIYKYKAKKCYYMEEENDLGITQYKRCFGVFIGVKWKDVYTKPREMKEMEKKEKKKKKTKKTNPLDMLI